VSAPHCKTIFKLHEQKLCRNDEAWIATADVSIQTKHHLGNLLAAFALGEACGFDKDAMLKVVRTFVGVPHRCQKVLEQNNILWINDSKGTTVAATIAALESFGATIVGKIILIAGGDGKDADFSPLTPLFAKYCRAVILFGRDAEKIAAIVPKSVEQNLVKTLAQTVAAAEAIAQPGDAVLLSPACASTDMFKNYVERGEQFMELVNKGHHV
jgi:UDP-N-acetylmuramoylalanine--D-glutamate ligase